MFKINPHSAFAVVCILSLLGVSNRVAAQKKTGSKTAKPKSAAASTIKPDVQPILIAIPSSEPRVDLGYMRIKKTEVAAAVSVVEKNSVDELMAVSIDALLQGQAAGIQVTNVSGAPGSGALTTIRGASTLHAGTLPLYIIDGIPVKTYRFINPLGRNVDNNPLADINPGDIASITVLKDAQATALYGMRGANGVVIVTTTGGTAGKTYLDFSAYSGIMTAPKQLPVLNASAYRD
jgi:TonB-dependent SusC/RagA subfamily outer membrane receptor